MKLSRDCNPLIATDIRNLMLAGVVLFSLAQWMGPIFCYTATYFSLLDNREFESLQIESDDLKPGRKKKGRKPEIQVVTVDPPSSLPENIKGPRKADKK